MKRRSFKYIFVVNCVIVFSIVSAIVLFKNVGNKNEDIPAFISTPLINSKALSADFCQNASSAVIIDAKSGAVIYEKNAHEKRPMASTTKIMTALCVLENASPDDVIEVAKEAAGIQGTSIYLKAGEKITVNDLLYGLLLESGNDAATALAVGVFGSEKNCIDYMNKRCHSMGCVSTSFENPHGLDSENHYTTAYELALITSEAMKNDTFRKIVSSRNYTTAGENPRYFSNHNRLLLMDECFVGVKTGYTSRAGRCLVSCGQKGNEEYISVTLCDRNDWNDHKSMLSFAFENFDSFEIAKKDSFVVFSGFDRYSCTEDVFVTAFGGDEFDLNYKVIIDGTASKLEYSSDGVPLGTVGLVLKDG